jgi:hypothetical protein
MRGRRLQISPRAGVDLLGSGLHNPPLSGPVPFTGMENGAVAPFKAAWRGARVVKGDGL